jgi:hypothetical protein
VISSALMPARERLAAVGAAICVYVAALGGAVAQTPVLIQPPNLSGASTSGTLPGEPGVSSSGSSTYRISIDVPPGTAEIQPSLALTYDSRRSDGLMGLGWSVSGLSTITRCPANLAVDGVPGKVGLDANDRYCLDGQRLLLVAGTYGATGEYRTEIDGISRVTSVGTNAANGPTSWKVEIRSGRVQTYGATADSFLEAPGTSKPLLWALNRVEDLRGVFYSVEYTKTAATGEHYPSQIRYSGKAGVLDPYAAVRFEYETAPRPDNVIRFQGGAKTLIAKRLSNLKTVVNTAINGTGGSTVSEYRFTYAVSPSSKRSLVDSISWCGATGECLPATAFVYQQHTTAHDNFSATGSGS